jgi:hypothetical protein
MGVTGLWAEDITKPDCGGLGQRRCQVDDAEYWAMQDLAMPFTGCEFDLEPDNPNPLKARCRDRIRFTRPKLSGWLAWATAQQRYIIGADQPINWVTHVGSHNAYSNANQGFVSIATKNQELSITDQLNAGMRMLELDAHYFLGEVRLCHAQDTSTCIVSGNVSGRLWAYAMREIRQWLDANPEEVIVILIENKVPDDRVGALVESIEHYLGSKAFLKVAGIPFTAWPTMQELRQANKQVVIFSTRAPNSAAIWNKSDFLAGSNRPNNANPTFPTCLDADGNPAVRRDFTKWFDIAEGRSGSNLVERTGLLNEAEVAAFSRCTASLIGLDFVESLGSAPPLLREDGPDRRLEASIWSYEPGDQGLGGPALLRQVTGRWKSNPEIQARPLACALRSRTGATFQDRGWRITPTVHLWNQANGEQACVASFGSSYTFDFPRNAYQNQQLLEAMARAGASEVWLNFRPSPIPLADADSIVVQFSAERGGPAPAPQTIELRGVPGFEYEVRFAVPSGTPPWLRAVSRTGRFSADGRATLTLFADLPSETNLYTARAEVHSPPAMPLPQTVIEALLVYTDPTTTTITSTKNPANQGDIVTLTARVSSPGERPSGRLTIYEQTVDAGSGRRTVRELVSANVSGANPAELAFIVPMTTAGTRFYEAAFTDQPAPEGPLGRPRLTHSNSYASLEQRVNPRITASPAALSFTWQKGSSAAAPVRTISASSPMGGVSASLLPEAPWLQLTGPDAGVWTAKLVTGAANNLNIGTYATAIVFKDAGSDGLVNAVPVTLTVTTPLVAAPANLEFLVSTQPASATIEITAASPIPFEVQSTQPWLTVVSGLGGYMAPATLQVLVDPRGLSRGRYSGVLTFRSPMASQTAKVNIEMEVVGATVFTSNYPGRTVIVDGQAYPMPASFTFAPRSLHTVEAPQPQDDGGVRYSFVRWLDSPNRVRTIEGRSDGATYSVEFARRFRLDAASSFPAGGSVQVTPASADGYYAPGTMVRLDAVANLGYRFAGYVGDAQGAQPRLDLVMDTPKNVTAIFAEAEPVQVTIRSNANQGRARVAGQEYSLPVTLLLIPGRTYEIAALDTTLSEGARLRFLQWSHGGNATQMFVAPPADATLEVVFALEYLVTLTPSPAAGGTVSGAGWIQRGSVATLAATANSGFLFTGFSGDLSSAESTVPVTVMGPLNVVANFRSSELPRLYATTAGPRSDGPNGMRLVPLKIVNAGTGYAADVRLASISGIRVMSGSGTVSVPGPFPLAVGDLDAGGVRTVDVPFLWPDGATRVQFTVHLTHSVTGSTFSNTLTLFR